MSGWGSIYRNSLFAMRTHSEALAQLQLQAASGARVLRPSDDPADANRIIRLQTERDRLDAYTSNLSNLATSLDEISNALQQMSSTMLRVRELVTQATTGTLSQDNRKAVAAEVDSLLEHTLSLANHQSMGRYLFGGANISTAPYQATRESGQVVSVAYQGSYDDLPVPVSQGVTHSGLVVGERIFRSDDRQEPLFLGSTGAAAGAGTSSAQGSVWLTLEHTATDYAAGAQGLAAGNGDTILGEHVLKVTAGTQVIQLDGGPAVEFAGTETDLAVTNADGDVVHVDMTGWSGADATVALTGTGRMSIDDGDSWTALTTFTGDVAVTDAATGRVLNVDTTGITRCGLEPVRVPGTYNVFDALIAVRDLMANSRGLSDSQQVDLLNQGLQTLEETMSNIEQGLTSVGSRLQAMDSLNATLDSLAYNAKLEQSQIGDADLVQVATDIARTQTLYEMTLATASRLLSLSLLDFIQ